MNELTKTKASTVLLVTTIGAFLSSFAGSAVNVALPVLGADLALGGVALSWVSTAFVLGSAILLLPMGRVGDIFGRRRLLLAGFAVYALGTLATALAPTGPLLIAFRGLTGLGSSMLAPTSGAILVASFPPKDRGRVLGINVAAVYFGLSAGPFLGGFLTALVGWRGLFFINAGAAAFVFLLSLVLLKDEWRSARGEPMDWKGTLIYGAGLAALLVGISEVTSPTGLGLTLAGAGALGLFAWWQTRTSHPLLDVGLFLKNRIFALSNLAAMVSYSATFSVAFFLSLYLESVRGLPPQVAGVFLVTQPLVQALFSPLTGRLSDRIEPRYLASAGMVLTAAGLGVLALLDAASPLGLVAGALVLLGLGFALFSSPNTNAVMGAVDRSQVGVASATISTMRVVGMAASMGLALVLFSTFLGTQAVSEATRDAFLTAEHLAFLISAVLCFLGIFASLARGKVSRG